MLIWYDVDGNISLERNDQLFVLEIGNPPEGFPKKECGGIVYDFITHQQIIDQETEYEYKIDTINKKLKKITLVDKFYAGEFTIEQFKQKLLKKFKFYYLFESREEDSIIMMYLKRKELKILSDEDTTEYNKALERYRKITFEYKETKKRILNSDKIEELYEIWKSKFINNIIRPSFNDLTTIDYKENKNTLINDDEIKTFADNFERWYVIGEGSI